jgi:hypothetical protein
METELLAYLNKKRWMTTLSAVKETICN